MSTKLILIRHGQTLWNKNKRYSGFTDVSLSKKGRLEARKLYLRLKNNAIDRIYASDKKRALQTAKIIFKKKNIEKIHDLREIHFGVFEGLTHSQILKRHSVVYKKWLRDPYSVKIPRGEDLVDFKKRIINAIKKIISVTNRGGSAFGEKNKTIAVVTHGGAISVFINHLLKTKKFWSTIPKSASLSIIEHKNGKIKINLFNDVSHLIEAQNAQKIIPPSAGCH